MESVLDKLDKTVARKGITGHRESVAYRAVERLFLFLFHGLLLVEDGIDFADDAASCANNWNSLLPSRIFTRDMNEHYLSSYIFWYTYSVESVTIRIGMMSERLSHATRTH